MLQIPATGVKGSGVVYASAPKQSNPKQRFIFQIRAHADRSSVFITTTGVS